MFICFSWFLLTCHEDQQNFHLLVRSVCMLFDSFRVRVMYENFFFQQLKFTHASLIVSQTFFLPFCLSFVTLFCQLQTCGNGYAIGWRESVMCEKRECLLSTLRPRRFFYSFHHGSLKTKFSRVRAIQSGSL